MLTLDDLAGEFVKQAIVFGLVPHDPGPGSVLHKFAKHLAQHLDEQGWIAEANAFDGWPPSKGFSVGVPDSIHERLDQLARTCTVEGGREWLAKWLGDTFLPAALVALESLNARGVRVPMNQHGLDLIQHEIDAMAREVPALAAPPKRSTVEEARAEARTMRGPCYVCGRDATAHPAHDCDRHRSGFE